MMKTRQIITVLVITLTGAGGLCAQPGDLGQLELSVTEKFKAEVAEASRLSEQPGFDDTTTSRIPVSYRISSQPIAVKFRPEPIEHARIARVPVPELYRGMARLGFGLYTTPLAEAYWNSGRSGQRSYGFWGRHFSTRQGAQHIFADNGLSQNELGGYYTKFFRSITWRTELQGRWDKYSYYGVDHLESVPDSIPFISPDEPDPAFNWYRHYEVNSVLKAQKDQALGALNDINLRYYNLSNAWNDRENLFRLGSRWKLPAGQSDLLVDVNMNWFGLEQDSLQQHSQSHLTFQARPHITRSLSGVLFDFGLNVYGNDYRSDLTGGEFQFFFFPELLLRYALVEDVLTLKAGVQGQARQNTMRHLIDDNPYLRPDFTSRPTRTSDIFGAIDGIFSATTSFSLRGGMMLHKDLALYYRDPEYQTRFVTDSSYLPGLDLRYDNVQEFYLNGEIAMNINNNLHASLGGVVRSFSLEQEEAAWHRPNFEASMGLEYTFREKLKIQSQWRYLGVRPAFTAEDNDRLDPELPAFLNTNLRLEYLYNSRLSGFIQISNLLNQKYDLYLGYKAQRINFLFGFDYRFP